MSEIEQLGDMWLRNLLNPLIIQDDQGRLVFYSRYLIELTEGHWQVYVRNSGTKLRFTSRKNAAVWCVLDRYGHYAEATRVLDLDSRLGSIETHIQIHKRLTSCREHVVEAVNRAKLAECIYNRKRFRYELNKYINLADISQQRGFQNELTRTSRKQKNTGRSSGSKRAL